MKKKKAVKKKKYYAKPLADLSLQVWRNKEGTPVFTITSNPRKDGEDFCTGIDQYMFSRCLTRDPRISINELIWFCDFFDKVRQELKERINK